MSIKRLIAIRTSQEKELKLIVREVFSESEYFFHQTSFFIFNYFLLLVIAFSFCFLNFVVHFNKNSSNMDMRIISYNVNGIRAAIKKGFIDWLKTGPADVICLQEIKAQESDIDIDAIQSAGYRPYFFCAQKKGYSGVGILSKLLPDNMELGHSNEKSDFEGRVIRADYGDITLVNAYFPSGTSGEERQAYKYVWLDEFLDYLNDLKKTRNKIIVCGDYNIAHKEIDIHNPKTSKRTTGFLPEERAWMDKLLENGFVDSFRYLNKEANQYSWWHVMRPSNRLDNKGWRIDYINVTTNLQNQIKEVNIFPEVKHSDHCPVYLKLEL